MRLGRLPGGQTRPQMRLKCWLKGHEPCINIIYIYIYMVCPPPSGPCVGGRPTGCMRASWQMQIAMQTASVSIACRVPYLQHATNTPTAVCARRGSGTRARLPPGRPPETPSLVAWPLLVTEAGRRGGWGPVHRRGRRGQTRPADAHLKSTASFQFSRVQTSHCPGEVCGDHTRPAAPPSRRAGACRCRGVRPAPAGTDSATPLAGCRSAAAAAACP